MWLWCQNFPGYVKTNVEPLYVDLCNLVQYHVLVIFNFLNNLRTVGELVISRNSCIMQSSVGVFIRSDLCKPLL
jgi:hypothetical protein